MPNQPNNKEDSPTKRALRSKSVDDNQKVEQTIPKAITPIKITNREGTPEVQKIHKPITKMNEKDESHESIDESAYLDTDTDEANKTITENNTDQKENKEKEPVKPKNKVERDLYKIIENQNKDLDKYEKRQEEDKKTIQKLRGKCKKNGPKV